MNAQEQQHQTSQVEPGPKDVLTIREVTSCAALTGVANLKVVQEVRKWMKCPIQYSPPVPRPFPLAHLIKGTDLQRTITMTDNNEKKQFLEAMVIAWQGTRMVT